MKGPLAGYSRALHAHPSSLRLQALLAHRVGHQASSALGGVEGARAGWVAAEGAGCVACGGYLV